MQLIFCALFNDQSFDKSTRVTRKILTNPKHVNYQSNSLRSPAKEKLIMFGLAGGDPRLSFKRTIAYGDLAIVYEKHEIMRPIIVTPNAELHNRFGVFMHNDWVGKPFGSRVLSVKGVQGYVYILAATPEIWTLCLQHRTQILYLADISLVIMYLEIVPGCLVLESGTGTGSLTTSIARSVAPNGHVHTFDFHEQRAQSARADFDKNGISNLVTVGVRDIQGEGFPDEFQAKVDSIFLDLPQPWCVVPSAAKMLKQDGVMCSFSPCIEQVQCTCEALASQFTEIRTFEILLRHYEILRDTGATSEMESGNSRKRKHDPSSVNDSIATTTTVFARPCRFAKGHTGYLTFARLKFKSS
ncbi:putative tRNA (Adenine-N(1)-)-methyltransferase catalytic subunit [Zostera marina]|uniref:tRNA (adenine(58)-N(1))-methyltransferase n=1 Tax=Zostera marina TaxID=29655 RepID=A0A0K9NRM8_ZOSMR|nr:putative tRNA (Adenine-N(1)-)-methyltransferase catalytic subunit [Zostera marina]